MKTSTVGAYEAALAVRAGFDSAITQGITALAAIREVQWKAERWQRHAEVDLTGVQDPIRCVREVQGVGVSLVLCHRSTDEEVTQGAAWGDDRVHRVREMCGLGLDVAVAGRITSEMLPLRQGTPTNGVVVGRAIIGQIHPAWATGGIAQSLLEIWPHE